MVGHYNTNAILQKKTVVAAVAVAVAAAVDVMPVRYSQH